MSKFVPADQITLKNGDRLTGTITTADSTSLNLKTDYAGDLTIKWDAIQSISSDQPLYVTPKTGRWSWVQSQLRTASFRLQPSPAARGPSIKTR